MQRPVLTAEKHNFDAWGQVIVGVTLLCGFVAVVAAKKPVLLLALPLAIPAALAAVLRPALFTLLAAGLFYINAPAVAVRFHGLPMIIGAAVVPMLLAIPIAHGWLLRRAPMVIDPIFLLGVLFLLVQLVASLFSNDRAVSLAEVRETATEGLLLYFLVFNAVRSAAALRHAIWALLVAGAAMGGLCCFQYATKTYDKDYGGFAQQESLGFFTGDSGLEGQVRQQRLAGPIGEKNRFAQIMLMLIPLGLFRIWNERRAELRILAMATTALTGLGLLLTFSRAAAFGFAAMLAVMMALRYITSRQVLGMMLGMALLLLMLPQYLTRLASLGAVFNNSHEISLDNADGSIRGRLTEAVAALYMFADHPWTGVGPGMYRYHFQHYAEIVGTDIRGAKVHEELRQPHVLYFGLAAELGLPGLIAFVLLNLSLLLRLNSVRRATVIAGRPDLGGLVAGFMLSMIGYLSTSVFLHLAYARYFWFMTALASAACAVVASQLPQSSARSSAQHQRPR
jgi:O-antigen ligase